ncbi:hypothetical protein [Streptomyces mirabilis]|uniref:hypothetical protein n=1 Tax=Streptomyces mirabilis TaxID=68239 RepID=UPI0036DDEC80
MKAITPPKLMPPFHSSTARGTLPIEQTIHPHHRNPAVLRDHQGAHHQGPDPPGHGAREGEWRRAVALLSDLTESAWGIMPYTAFLGALRLADEIMVEFEVARLEPVDGTG